MKIYHALPLITIVGATAPNCACGACPTCLATYSSITALGIYVGTKKLFKRLTPKTASP
ncbi:MAG: hypothetical protein NZL90_04445 [Aquificaceae bacterium]|nr:hypothetical protein [Aquificaceae bacterium]MDW8237607.1 hypothetical protein [Aquificaceae bacterium]